MDALKEKPFYQSVDFWLVFAGALLVSLLIGGLVSGLFGGCPAFGWVLLSSVLASGIAAYLYHTQIGAARKRQVRRAAATRISQLAK